MATGGTGDVLTGVIAAWMAQLLDPEAACRAGVYLHGRAGDLASSVVGQPALTAGDVVANLGRAWQDTLGVRREGRGEGDA
jgi:NAD(P)H-hydrate epimerase